MSAGNVTVTLTTEELAVVLHALDARTKLAESFVSYQCELHYWEVEQGKALVLLQKIRTLRDAGPQPGSLDAKGYEVVV